MFEAVIKALITICLFVAVGVIVIWVLGALGIFIPPKLVTIFWIIVGLICILILYRLFQPWVGKWFP